MNLDNISDLSSDLSSVGSLSPPPPDLDSYPTPPASQYTDGDSTPSNRSEVNLVISNNGSTDGTPPARKKRKIEPKTRTTLHLNLKSLSSQTPEDEEPLNLLIKTLRKRRKIVVVAGAGISVSAGIPDFRSSGGLFKSLKKEHKLKASGKQLFDASVYKNDDTTSSFHDMVRSLSTLSSSAKPTPFHHLLARLAHDGRLLRLYTQNVDGIDTSLPPLATAVPLNVKAPWPRTIQLHGGLEKMVCQKCNDTSDFQPALFQGPHPPPCGACTEKDSVRDVAGKRSHGVGKLRPRIVLYNEYNPDEEAIGSVVTSDLRTRPDALVVVGTSLKIPGVKRIVREMCAVVRGRKHGMTIWINNDGAPTGKEFEDCWDLIIKGESDQVAHHVALRNWNDNPVETFDECTASDVERVKENLGVPSVVVKKEDSTRSDPVPSNKLVPTLVIEKESGESSNTVSASENVTSGTHATLSNDKMKNPASKGRSIANVLGKGKPKAPVRKAKVIKKPAKKADIPKQGLKLNFAVTKSTKPEATKDKVNDPMVVISPQAARNNGPIFPNLVREESNSPSWNDRGTVSPKSKPSGMAMLID